MLLPIWKQHQSKVSAMQLNGAQGHIYLTITFAVLIFMIKAIRHLWVACARALRLTTIVKRAAIRGFTWMSVSSVCATARPVMETPLNLVNFLKGYDTDIVSHASIMKSLRTTRSVHIILSFSSLLLIFFLFLLRSHIFDVSPSAPLTTGWTALYSPLCLEGHVYTLSS